MGSLIECRGCTRHVRIEDARCPFCGRASTTAAPARVFAFVLPLMVMACAGGTEGDPKAKDTPAKTDDAKAKADDGAEAKPEDGKTTPDPEAAEDGGNEPGDGGDAADPTPISDDREMATKYGGPPLIDGPISDEPKPDGPDTPSAKDDEPEIRPARKYGAPPRPAPKYGGPPRPPKPIPKEPSGL